MPDQHQALRELPFPAVMQQLGFSLEHFKTRKGGTEWYGPCPVHQPKNNKGCFSYNVDGRWRCFGCPAKGRGSLDLAMQVKGCGFKEAVELLNTAALIAEAKLPQIKQLQVRPEAAEASAPVPDVPTENKPFNGTYDKYAVESPWLDARGFTPEALKRFEVFQYDNPKRQSLYRGKILLAVRRFADGELVGYLARNPAPKDDEPKYIWPKGFHKALEVFGAWQLKQAGNLPLRICYLVESPFCALKFHQLGFPAVSPFGWSLSPQQVDILAQIAKGFIYLPDRNKAAEIGPYVHQLTKKAWVKTPDLPEDIDDPEHLSLDQIKALT